jgi:FtsH ternary system domain X3-analog
VKGHMAEMIIMLRRDPNTGKQNIIVKLDSDPDALPMEHEQMHRKLVQELTGVKIEDQGEVIVERVPEAQPNEPTNSPNEPQKRKEGQKGS